MIHLDKMSDRGKEIEENHHSLGAVVGLMYLMPSILSVFVFL